MRKSGLHKQISSIFDGVPVPNNQAVNEDADSTSVLTPTETETASQKVTEQKVKPEAPGSKPSLMKRLSTDPSECASAPSIQVDRPMPLPKSAMISHKSGPGFSDQIKKALFGSEKKALDAHQKKMAVLVGVLAFVFAGVMYFSLGGVGESKTASDDKADNNSAPISASFVSPQDWKNPEPLPAGLRNATSPAARRPSSKQADTPTAKPGELRVKGIVFSKNKPSAIINNQILTEGQEINGVQITKITKDAVEFEDNGTRWSQNVQR